MIVFWVSGRVTLRKIEKFICRVGVVEIVDFFLGWLALEIFNKEILVI